MATKQPQQRYDFDYWFNELIKFESGSNNPESRTAYFNGSFTDLVEKVTSLRNKK